MGKVIPLDSLRQHMVVNTPDRAHVIPAVWFDKFVAGEIGITSLEDHEDTMRSIVPCWLAHLRKTH